MFKDLTLIHHTYVDKFSCKNYPIIFIKYKESNLKNLSVTEILKRELTMKHGDFFFKKKEFTY